MARILSTLPSVGLTNSPHLSAKSQRRRAAAEEDRMSERLQDARLRQEAEDQAEFLARDIVEHLLNCERMTVNGYTGTLPGELNLVPATSKLCLRDPGFQQARRKVVEGCMFILKKHGSEMEEVCLKDDIGAEQLEHNVKEALETIWEEPRNWGRLVSLFVAAYYLCRKIYQEEGRRSNKIESVIGWLARYLKENAVSWVVERGGFVSEESV